MKNRAETRESNSQNGGGLFKNYVDTELNFFVANHTQAY